MKFDRDYCLHRFPVVCQIIGSCHPFVPVIEFPNHVTWTSVNGIAFQVPSIFRASLPLYWDFNLPFFLSETEAVWAQSRILFSFGSLMIPGGYRMKNGGVLEKMECPLLYAFCFLRHPQNSGGRHRLGNTASDDTINRSRSLWGWINVRRIQIEPKHCLSNLLLG
jgi:hypothetical protein